MVKNQVEQTPSKQNKSGYKEALLEFISSEKEADVDYLKEGNLTLNANLSGEIIRIGKNSVGRLDHLCKSDMHPQELVTLIKGIDSQQNFLSSLILDDTRPSMDNWQGRTKEIKQLLSWLGDENTMLVGIEGLNGFGKSTLAAKIYDESAGFLGKFWAGVSQWPDFTLFAQRVLVQSKMQLTKEAVEAIAQSQLVDALVTCLRDERYLLVIDNLETLLHPDGQWRDAVYEQFFTTWLGCNGKSVILVTTQVKPNLPEKRLCWQQLGGLQPIEGTALLRQLNIQGSDAQLQEFSIGLSGHPLLLKLAAGFLNEEGPNLQLSYLQELWRADLKKAVTDPEIMSLHLQDFVRMVVVLEESFNRLSPKLQALLLNLSVYRRPFNYAAAAAQLPKEEVSEQDLQQLVKRCLLQEQTLHGQQWFQFQPLILAYAFSKAGNQTVAHEQASSYYLSIAKDSTWQTTGDLTEYLEVFYHWCQLKLYALAFDTIQHCDDFLARRGFNSLRVQLYGHLLQVWEPSFEEKSKFIDCLMRLSNAYFSLRQYSQATERYQQLLIAAREVNARDKEAFALVGLGSIYFLVGQVQSAIEFFEQSLLISRQISDRLGQAKSLNNLGNALNALGQFQQAIVLSQQSLDIHREIGNLDGQATALIHLGYAYNSLGQYQRAIEYYKQSLLFNQQNGSRTGEADALTSLGNAYYSIKQYQQAIELYQQALVIERQIGAARGEANALSGLGRVYRTLRQYPQAIDYYRQSLEIAHKIGDRQGEAISLGNLGTAYYSLKQYPLAIDYCQQQQAIAKEIGDRQGEANSLGNLGIAYQSLGQYQLAIEHHKSSLLIKQEIADKRGEANSWFNLGNALTKLNRNSEAIAAYQQARALYHAMGLDTDALDADTAIARLPTTLGLGIAAQSDSSVAEVGSQPVRRQFLPGALLRLLWQWYQQLWGARNPKTEVPRRQRRR